MKYFLTLFLIVLLSGCSSSAGNAVKDIGKQVTKCCAGFTVTQTCTLTQSADPVAATASPVSVFEITGRIPTW